MRAFEQSLEAAYIAAGQVDIAFLRARNAHKLSSTVGHGILSSFGAASNSVVEALGHAVKGHRLTEQLAERLGIFHAYGDTGKDSGDHKVFTGA